MEKATFAAGCFWQVEAEFRKIKGVISTQVGYTGGKTKNPRYEDLLKVFWQSHDPTQMNRQGPDLGAQYRSAIFYHNEKQKQAAIKSKEEEQKKHKNRIVTEITKASTFYRAEEYHQRYLEKRGLATCNI